MTDLKTSAEPVTATTLGAGDLLRVSQDLGGGTFGNAKMSGASLLAQTSALYPPVTRLISTGTGLTGGGSLAADRTIALANTAVSAGGYGSATQVATFTVNAQGQLTLAANVTVTPAFSSLTGTPTTLAGYGITDALPLSGGTLTGALTLAADPTTSLQAATKNYVDLIAQGLSPKNSALVATISNVTLLGNQTIDGVSVPSGSRILVQAQTLPATNGIYLTGAGAWTRTPDADTWDKLAGALIYIEEGTTYADCLFACTSDPGGTLGVTAVTWTLIAGAGTYTAGAGLTLSGRQFSVATNGVTNAMLAQMPTLTFKGNSTGGTANAADLTVAQAKTMLNLAGTNTGDQTITLTGDVTGSGTGSFGATIANNAVTNARAAQMAAGTIKGNNTAGTANASDLTASQATAMLSPFVASGASHAKGLVPDPGATSGTTKFLREDATWATPAGGGGGSPGGSDTQVQFNDGGAFGGDAGLTFVNDGSGNYTLQLGVATTTTVISNFWGADAQSLSELGTSLTMFAGYGFDDGSDGTSFGGNIFIGSGQSYGVADAGSFQFAGGNASNGDGGSQEFLAGASSGSGNGGHILLQSGSANTGSAGDIILSLSSNASDVPGNLVIPFLETSDPSTQSALFNDNGVLTFSGFGGAYIADAYIRMAQVSPTTGSTAPSTFGLAGTNATSTTVGSTSTSVTTRQIRTNWATAASAGSASGWFTTTRNIYVSSVAGQGGAWSSSIGALGTNTTGHQAFFGLVSTAALLGGDPSAQTNCIGVGFDAADLSSGNWWIMHNDGSGTCTRVDTGLARGVDAGIKLDLQNLIGTLNWNVTVTDINSGTVFTYQATSNAPVTATELGFEIMCRTGALTSACNIRLLNHVQKWRIN